GGARLGGVALLAEEAVHGEAFVQEGADGVLCPQVGLADEVGPALLARVELAAPLGQHGGTAPSRLAGRLPPDRSTFHQRPPCSEVRSQKSEVRGQKSMG